jgi:hypothetical protein
VGQECGEELGIIVGESRGVPLTQASDARGAAEQDIAEGDKAVTKLDPGRGDVCGGDSERNPGHETEQELDLF